MWPMIIFMYSSTSVFSSRSFSPPGSLYPISCIAWRHLGVRAPAIANILQAFLYGDFILLPALHDSSCREKEYLQ